VRSGKEAVCPPPQPYPPAMRLRFLVLALPLALAIPAAPVAQAGSGSATTPIGDISMSIPGGFFTEECTDFPYTIVITDASDDVQWDVDIRARRGSSSDRANGGTTDYGSGSFEDSLMICSGQGAGSWTATVTVQMRDTTDATAVYDRTMSIDFPVSLTETVTTIDNVRERSGKTKIRGTVLTTTGLSAPTAFGTATIKVKKSGRSWKKVGETQVDGDGEFRYTIDQTYDAGTKIRVVFGGTEESNASSSDAWTL